MFSNKVGQAKDIHKLYKDNNVSSIKVGLLKLNLILKISKREVFQKIILKDFKNFRINLIIGTLKID